MLRIPRLLKCNHGNCSQLGISHTGTCYEHYEHVTIDMFDVDGMVEPMGVEIECYGPGEIRMMSPSVVDDCSLDNGDTYPFWNIRSKSEIVPGLSDCDEPYAHEIKLLAEGRNMGKLAALTAIKVNAVGGSVDNTCGLHVHMSMADEERRSLYDHEIAKLWPYIMGIQPEFGRMFRERMHSEYVYKLYNHDDMISHYGWLSASDIGTIECRIHEGTLNPETLMLWIRVCRKLQSGFRSVLKDKPNKIAEKMRQGNFIGAFSHNSLAKQYLQSRM